MNNVDFSLLHISKEMLNFNNTRILSNGTIEILFGLPTPQKLIFYFFLESSTFGTL